jgi:hypothetical protein
MADVTRARVEPIARQTALFRVRRCPKVERNFIELGGARTGLRVEKAATKQLMKEIVKHFMYCK